MDHFNKKEIKDLLTNPSFVQWVKFPHLENEKKWEQWIKNNPDRKNDVALAREFILRMNFKAKYPESEQIEKSYQATLAKVNNLKRVAYSRPEGNGFSIFKIAATLLILIASVISVYLIVTSTSTPVQPVQVINEKIIQRKNPEGIRSKITLPDGSHVWLNAESEISYPAVFNSKREVNLVGEAFFEVVKDSLKPFIVNTRMSEIKVLGTSFNVNAYSDSENESISLIEGKVTVSFMENDTSSLLLPGEQIIINQKEGIRQNHYFDSLQVSGWTRGLLVFKNASKDEIVDKLSRWYGVKIEIVKQPASTWNVNGYFDNQSLERVLERLSFSKDFDFTIEDKNVTIKFN